ncbi:MAG: GGDEF domain-containing protein [Burkholderiaceae bacterium]|nr:GGDEF domain-containing protein [Burkholderiaceae bacterium]
MSVVFDIRTLFFFGAMTCVVCAITLFNLRRLHPPSEAAMRWAALAEAWLGAAMMLIALRGALPDLLTIPVANALGTSGPVLIWAGTRRLVHVEPRNGVTVAAILVLVGLQFALGTSLDMHAERIALTSLAQGGFALASAMLLMRRRGIDPALPLRWAIGFSSFFALVHVARLLHLAVRQDVDVRPDGMIGGSLVMVMVTAIFALAPMVYAMVILGLVYSRLGGELRQMARSDALTGLMTRRSFFEEGREAIQRMIAKRRMPVLMMLDVDRFKSINDGHGHTVGDRVLAHVARVLRDSVPEGALLARYGGEEFCLLLDCERMREALDHAQALNAAVRSSPYALTSRRELQTTISIGIAFGPAEGSSLEALLITADRRLFDAKACGRDCVIADDAPLELRRVGPMRTGTLSVTPLSPDDKASFATI